MKVKRRMAEIEGHFHFGTRCDRKPMGISESGKILIPGWKQASGTKGRVRRTHLLSNERYRILRQQSQGPSHADFGRGQSKSFWINSLSFWINSLSVVCHYQWLALQYKRLVLAGPFDCFCLPLL
jgi:hypothetical protein